MTTDTIISLIIVGALCLYIIYYITKIGLEED